MTVTVKLFAAFREAIGSGELEIQAPEQAKIAWLVDEIVRLYPQLDGSLNRAAYALNRTHVGPESVMADGDEVVLLPPVSGGSARERS